MEQKTASADAACEKQTVAVTGASGYIGSAIVKLLLERGYKVRATVRDTSNPAKVDHLKSLPKAAENLALFKAELMDEGCFDDIFAGCHGVFHTSTPVVFEAKDPENDVIKPAVFGTTNVLKSCEKVGVKVVVVTSSMYAAFPNPMPALLSEKHWSDAEEQRKVGNAYGCSKTLAERAAVEFLAKMPVDTAFRLVRICPTLVVGPMLQPSVNLSMKFFALLAKGIKPMMLHDSLSVVDVRDCAEHHVNAYEGNHEGRYFSVLEDWPLSVIWPALKHFNPDMKCPKPQSEDIKPVQTKQYDHTRMITLGVRERSMMQTLGEAVAACRERGLLDNTE